MSIILTISKNNHFIQLTIHYLTTMATDMRWNLFLNTAALFLIVQAVGLYTGSVIFATQEIVALEATGSIINFLVSFAVATIGLVLLLKFTRTGLFFKLLFAFLIFVGTNTVFAAFIPAEAAFLLAVEMVILRFCWPNVFSHNAVMMLAIAGIAATLGLLFSITAVLVILAVLSVYDVIAVYRTKHMISLFSGLLQKGIPFSLIVPDKTADINAAVASAQPGTGRFLLLGTGDLAFPIILAVSALRFGIISSLSVIAGSFVGLFFIHVILMKKQAGAIPALPPIVFFSLLAFILSLIITL